MDSFMIGEEEEKITSLEIMGDIPFSQMKRKSKTKTQNEADVQKQAIPTQSP